MAAMRKGDLIVHHPYDSFASSVERLVEQAVADPNVLAIKQTVYRTSDDSPLVPGPIRAAERGKQAVCMVGAQGALRRAGQHRLGALARAGRRPRGLRAPVAQDPRQVHPDHPPRGRRRAPLRARRHGQLPPDHCAPVHRLRPADLRRPDRLRRGRDVHQLTGFARPQRFRRVLIAPAHMRDGILDEIERTIAAKEAAGGSARIATKRTRWLDKRCIRALYRASQAGVPVDLNIRGICCLRPGVPGVSENIHVLDRRPVPRALAHLRVRARRRAHRLHRLGRSDAAQPRHARRAATPVRDATLNGDLLDTLERCFADNTNAWELGEDGAWARRVPGDDAPRNVQRELMERYAARATESASATPA